jgi:PKD repeat protein
MGDGGAGSYTGGDTAASQNPDYLFTAYGSFHVRCTVTDSAGNVITVEGDITLSPPGALVVTPSVTGNKGAAPLSTTFGSTVSGGTSPYTWAWDFGDGDTSAIEDPGVHVYTIPGNYTWTLKVTDAAGAVVTVGGSVAASTSTSSTTLYPSRIAQEPEDLDVSLSNWYLNSTSSGLVPDLPTATDNSNLHDEDANYVGNPGGVTKGARPLYAQKFGGAWSPLPPVRGLKVRIKATAETDSKVYIAGVSLVDASGAPVWTSYKTLKLYVPAAGGWFEIGNEVDLWGQPPAWFTEALLEDPDFGVCITTYCKATASAKWVKLDKVEMIVYH